MQIFVAGLQEMVRRRLIDFLCSRIMNLRRYQRMPKASTHRAAWLILVLVLSCGTNWSAEIPAAAHFRQNVRPILEKYCSDCHLDGMNKGGVAFDELKSDQALLAKHDLWLAVMKNLRAGLMPPEKKPRPSADERQRLEEW